MMTTISKLTMFISMMILGSLNVFAQCDGSYNGGAPVFLTDSISTTIGTDDFTIAFQTTAPGNIVISSSTGLEFLVDDMSMTTLINVNATFDISTGMNWSSNPAIMYNNSSHTGPFGYGTTGFIGVKKGNRYGWIELGQCGSTTCAPNAYEFPILDRCLNGVDGGPVLAGDSGTLSPLPADSIPTLSEWGLILLGLFISIIGLVSIKSLEQQKIFS